MQGTAQFMATEVLKANVKGNLISRDARILYMGALLCYIQAYRPQSFNG